MRIGVFDSGIGGKAVANELRAAFPNATVLTIDDRANVPYGTKSPDMIVRLTISAIRPLVDAECDVIVIACNTATAVAIETLRSRYPRQRFIGLEPMIKTAPTLSKTGTIAICATPATLRSERYANAKRLHGSTVTVFEPDCSDWAALIEADRLNKDRIDAVARQCLAAGADVVVLGCTHYHWIKDELTTTLDGRAQVIEPTEAIVRRIVELLRL